MEQLLDTELVKLAQKGEGRAFDILVARYQTKVTHLVYRYVKDTDTALDLVQDIFLKIFKNLVRFKGESKFSSWLFRVAVNDCIDHLRKVKVRKEQSLDYYQSGGFDVVDEHRDQKTAEVLELKQDRQRVRRALESLPEKQKAVVVMKVYEEMTFDDISEIVQEPVSTVKSRLYKALNTLGSSLRRQDFMERGGK
ncbi:MAG: sigma-70 family RNA polymerase sigma factor [Acidobacteriota bacterium]|nr:sigma-70 family RNA polymerase sigma factor [Acidobacteriota bacterium]